MELNFQLGQQRPSPWTRSWSRSPSLMSARTSCPVAAASYLRFSPFSLHKSSRFAPLEGGRRSAPCGVVILHATKRLRPTCEVEIEMEFTQEQVPEGTLELPDAAAFGVVSNEKGLISICGFGSLLSERSARYTFPNLLNFRVAVLPGFRRVFAHVAPVFLERGIANVATKEISSLSVVSRPGESVIVTVFEISISEVPAFIEREHEFRFLAVTLFSLQGEALSNKAVICARYSDKEYRQYRCQESIAVFLGHNWNYSLHGSTYIASKTDNEEYHRRYGRFNIDKIWRDDILPCRVYLRHCVLAAKNLSQGAYDSFLDHTYLGDRITSMRQYLAMDEQIMQEEPPPSLRERYGG